MSKLFLCTATEFRFGEMYFWEGSNKNTAWIKTKFKKINFEIFRSALYMKSVSMPLLML